MKKIIWIFGESATGKKTFIENIMNNSLDILDDLDLSNKRIDIVEKTIEKYVLSHDIVSIEKSRRQAILEDIKSFVENDNYDVLLLKGQSNDMNERFGNTLKEAAVLYPEIDKEIYLLEVSDMDLLYSRVVNKEWFLVNQQECSKMFPREWLDNAVVKHRGKVYSYIEFGYKITDIDSTNGYKLVNGKVK